MKGRNDIGLDCQTEVNGEEYFIVTKATEKDFLDIIRIEIESALEDDVVIKNGKPVVEKKSFADLKLALEDPNNSDILSAKDNIYQALSTHTIISDKNGNIVVDEGIYREALLSEKVQDRMKVSINEEVTKFIESKEEYKDEAVYNKYLQKTKKKIEETQNNFVVNPVINSMILSEDKKAFLSTIEASNLVNMLRAYNVPEDNLSVFTLDELKMICGIGTRYYVGNPNTILHFANILNPNSNISIRELAGNIKYLVNLDEAPIDSTAYVRIIFSIIDEVRNPQDIGSSINDLDNQLTGNRYQDKALQDFINNPMVNFLNILASSTSNVDYSKIENNIGYYKNKLASFSAKNISDLVFEWEDENEQEFISNTSTNLLKLLDHQRADEIFASLVPKEIVKTCNGYKNPNSYLTNNFIYFLDNGKGLEDLKKISKYLAQTPSLEDFDPKFKNIFFQILLDFDNKNQHLPEKERVANFMQGNDLFSLIYYFRNDTEMLDFLDQNWDMYQNIIFTDFVEQIAKTTDEQKFEDLTTILKSSSSQAELKKHFMLYDMYGSLDNVRRCSNAASIYFQGGKDLYSLYSLAKKDGVSVTLEDLEGLENDKLNALLTDKNVQDRFIDLARHFGNFVNRDIKHKIINTGYTVNSCLLQLETVEDRIKFINNQAFIDKIQDCEKNFSPEQLYNIAINIRSPESSKKLEDVTNMANLIMLLKNAPSSVFLSLPDNPEHIKYIVKFLEHNPEHIDNMITIFNDMASGKQKKLFNNIIKQKEIPEWVISFSSDIKDIVSVKDTIKQFSDFVKKERTFLLDDIMENSQEMRNGFFASMIEQERKENDNQKQNNISPRS